MKLTITTLERGGEVRNSVEIDFQELSEEIRVKLFDILKKLTHDQPVGSVIGQVSFSNESLDFTLDGHSSRPRLN